MNLGAVLSTVQREQGVDGKSAIFVFLSQQSQGCFIW